MQLLDFFHKLFCSYLRVGGMKGMKIKKFNPPPKKRTFNSDQNFICSFTTYYICDFGFFVCLFCFIYFY